MWLKNRCFYSWVVVICWVTIIATGLNLNGAIARQHRILVDTDVKADDLFSLLYLLKLNRSNFDLKVSVHYNGKLQKNNKYFDSGGKPFKFRLGIGHVIKGWDIGLEGMRVGDKRRLIVPPSMGYVIQCLQCTLSLMLP